MKLTRRTQTVYLLELTQDEFSVLRIIADATVLMSKAWNQSGHHDNVMNFLADIRRGTDL